MIRFSRSLQVSPQKKCQMSFPLKLQWSRMCQIVGSPMRVQATGGHHKFGECWALYKQNTWGIQGKNRPDSDVFSLCVCVCVQYFFDPSPNVSPDSQSGLSLQHPGLPASFSLPRWESWRRCGWKCSSDTKWILICAHSMQCTIANEVVVRLQSSCLFPGCTIGCPELSPTLRRSREMCSKEMETEELWM